jgi:hypothetical protein
VLLRALLAQILIPDVRGRQDRGRRRRLHAGGSESRSTFSVMTYNVEGLPWPIRSGRGDKLKAIGRELAAMREKGVEPDVVLLQEGFRDEVGT